MNDKRLLIIEDDVDVAEMLVTFFQGQGYEVLHADMGAQGISIARSKFPNLILLDVMLPDMVGFDVCRELRTTNLTKYIPILFLTQRDARSDKVAGLELGADDYITKPFDIEELRLRVQGSIRRATRDHLHEPRTGLPTGPLIQAEYERLRDQDGWQYLEIIVTGFDDFRDRYGFLAADEAMSLTSSVITQAIAEHGTQNDFVGAIAESSKFVLFTQNPDVDKLSEKMRDVFMQRVETLYSFMDVERGYFMVKEGTPEERQVPLMTLKTSTYLSDNNADGT